jgi:hypothetical protein
VLIGAVARRDALLAFLVCDLEGALDLPADVRAVEFAVLGKGRGVPRRPSR